MQPRHVAVLCIVTLAAGIYSHRHAHKKAPTVIAAGARAGAPGPRVEPGLPQTPAPPTTVAAAVSLPDLARELMARAATSTTRPRLTTTTTTKGAATAASTPTPTTTAAATNRAAAEPAPARPPSTTTPLTPLTTLLEKVAPPVAAVSNAITRSDSGVASWFDAPTGTCAHRTLPMGTVVKVTRVHNGASATCKVDDRGPTVATGRLIDLSRDTFERLAAAEAGLIDVTIEW